VNYLLDTHTLIWAFSDQNKLSSRVSYILSDPANAFFVSATSFWEIALKFSTGKLKIKGTLPEELPSLSLAAGFQLIPVSPDESATFHWLDKVNNHKDPFDRMLIWQAIQRNLILITKDDDLHAYKIAGLKTIW
jgi:PIN domain nuclease of toxin-antitoxin system